MTLRKSRTGLLSAIVAACLASSQASAAAFHVDARTEAQAYQIRAYRGTDPENPVLLPRRRIVQYLGVNGFELVTGQDLAFESNLRVFTDFGLPRGEAQRIDGLRSEDADLLYAYARYRGGGFEGVLGRQLYVDVMDWMSFDGLKLRYRLPFGLGVEAYGGLWVKAAGFLGSSFYQPDGIRESDERRLAANSVFAEEAYDDLEPVFGGKLFIEDLKGLSASVGYRRSYLGGKVNLDRLLAQARYFHRSGFNVFAGTDVDLYQLRLAQARLQVRYDANLFALSVEGLRLSPVFSSDSIWYYFSSSPRDELRLRADWTPVGPLRFYAQGLASLYAANVKNLLGVAVEQGLAGPSSNLGGSVGTSFRKGGFRSAADVTYRAGFGGRQLWVDATAGYSPALARWTLDGRLSVANIQDGMNPLLRGTFFGAQLWASYAFTQAARLSLAVEENLNPFTRSETKLFFLFDLKAIL